MLFLTGATGLVGGGLLRRLLATRPELRVVALARRPSPALAHPRVTVVAGDVTRAGCGIDAELRASITEVIHCAADTRFSISLDDARAANAVGTANVLALARGCPRLEKFAHLSTVYVAGRRTGRIPAAPADTDAGFSNVYQRSKHEAEQLVLEAMDQLPIAIYRLSTILGEAATGRVRRFNYVHKLLRLLPKNVLPLLPGDLAAPIDLIPFEWAIEALATLFETRFRAGGVHQVCAGPRASLTVGDLRDLTLRGYESHGVGPLRVPEFVSLEEYEAFVQESMLGTDVLLKEVLRALGHFLPHLALHQAFEPTDVGVSLLPVRDYYGKVLAYCLATDWGKHPPVGVLT
jgi:nucleoside-diphosphate-sugar epimerase